MDEINVEEVISLLDIEYPDARCMLVYSQPYQLLIAARLSARCTDEKVNKITKILFSEYKTLEDFANARIEDVEKIVKPCGLFHTKAGDIISIARDVLQKFGGKVPSTMEDLIQLSGVGRKTANLILGDIYHLPAVICDTHCIRITNRLGWVKSTNPVKVEKELSKILPPDKSTHFCHLMVHHGRKICKSRGPKCGICPILKYCIYGQLNSVKHD